MEATNYFSIQIPSRPSHPAKPSIKVSKRAKSRTNNQSKKNSTSSFKADVENNVQMFQPGLSQSQCTYNQFAVSKESNRKSVSESTIFQKGMSQQVNKQRLPLQETSPNQPMAFSPSAVGGERIESSESQLEPFAQKTQPYQNNIETFSPAGNICRRIGSGGEITQAGASTSHPLINLQENECQINFGHQSLHHSGPSFSQQSQSNPPAYGNFIRSDYGQPAEIASVVSTFFREPSGPTSSAVSHHKTMKTVKSSMQQGALPKSKIKRSKSRKKSKSASKSVGRSKSLGRSKSAGRMKESKKKSALALATGPSTAKPKKKKITVFQVPSLKQLKPSSSSIGLKTRKKSPQLAHPMNLTVQTAPQRSRKMKKPQSSSQSRKRSKSTKSLKRKKKAQDGPPPVMMPEQSQAPTGLSFEWGQNQNEFSFPVNQSTADPHFQQQSDILFQNYPINSTYDDHRMGSQVLSQSSGLPRQIQPYVVGLQGASSQRSQLSLENYQMPEEKIRSSRTCQHCGNKQAQGQATGGRNSSIKKGSTKGRNQFSRNSTRSRAMQHNYSNYGAGGVARVPQNGPSSLFDSDNNDIEYLNEENQMENFGKVSMHQLVHQQSIHPQHQEFLNCQSKEHLKSENLASIEVVSASENKRVRYTPDQQVPIGGHIKGRTQSTEFVPNYPMFSPQDSQKSGGQITFNKKSSTHREWQSRRESSAKGHHCCCYRRCSRKSSIRSSKSKKKTSLSKRSSLGKRSSLDQRSSVGHAQSHAVLISKQASQMKAALAESQTTLSQNSGSKNEVGIQAGVSMRDALTDEYAWNTTVKREKRKDNSSQRTRPDHSKLGMLKQQFKQLHQEIKTTVNCARPKSPSPIGSPASTDFGSRTMFRHHVEQFQERIDRMIEEKQSRLSRRQKDLKLLADIKKGQVEREQRQKEQDRQSQIEDSKMRAIKKDLLCKLSHQIDAELASFVEEGDLSGIASPVSVSKFKSKRPTGRRNTRHALTSMDLCPSCSRSRGKSKNSLNHSQRLGAQLAKHLDLGSHLIDEKKSKKKSAKKASKRKARRRSSRKEYSSQEWAEATLISHKSMASNRSLKSMKSLKSTKRKRKSTTMKSQKSGKSLRSVKSGKSAKSLKSAKSIKSAIKTIKSRSKSRSKTRSKSKKKALKKKKSTSKKVNPAINMFQNYHSNSSFFKEPSTFRPNQYQSHALISQLPKTSSLGGNQWLSSSTRGPPNGQYFPAANNWVDPNQASLVNIQNSIPPSISQSFQNLSKGGPTIIDIKGTHSHNKRLRFDLDALTHGHHSSNQDLSHISDRLHNSQIEAHFGLEQPSAVNKVRKSILKNSSAKKRGEPSPIVQRPNLHQKTTYRMQSIGSSSSSSHIDSKKCASHVKQVRDSVYRLKHLSSSDSSFSSRSSSYLPKKRKVSKKRKSSKKRKALTKAQWDLLKKLC